MNLDQHVVPVFVTFITTIFFIYICYNFSLRIDLVDNPNWRKNHKGKIPLIGGLAIIFGFTFGCLISERGLTEWRPLFLCMLPLAVVGVIDDHGDLSVNKRIIFQVITCLIMFYYGGVKISNFGNLFGLGDINIDGIELVVSVVCVIGVINALNLIDGIDGLCSSVSIITCLSILTIVKINETPAEISLVIYFTSALIGFLIVNLGIFGRLINKVFLGDAGTTIIGFFLCWYLIKLSMSPDPILRPICAVWILALPIMDTISVIFRRLLAKKSPFHAGRDHVHHILLSTGKSQYFVLILLSIFSILISGIGVFLEVNAVPEIYMFIGIMIIFLIYHYALQIIYFRTKMKNF